MDASSVRATTTVTHIAGYDPRGARAWQCPVGLAGQRGADRRVVAAASATPSLARTEPDGRRARAFVRAGVRIGIGDADEDRGGAAGVRSESEPDPSDDRRRRS